MQTVHTVHTPVEPLSNGQIMGVLPPCLRRSLSLIHGKLGGELSLTGGVVRDLLLGRSPADIDLTVMAGARIWAGHLAKLTGGALVPLGRDGRDEDAARVVSQGLTVDFSSFRQGAQSLAEDLCLRDLTINALAFRIDSLLTLPSADAGSMAVLIDPTGGLDDLRRGLIRATSATSFTSDPLRLVRVFRFALTLGFTVEAATLDRVRRQCALVRTVASERIAYELDQIMAATDAHPVVLLMAEHGLLGEIIPELMAETGMERPKDHPLDLWGHRLEGLWQMERIIARPATFFPDFPDFPEIGEKMAAYLTGTRQLSRLKWAALLHGLEKPAVFALSPEKDACTFSSPQDQIGLSMFNAFALRLRWSNEERRRVGCFIAGQIWPLHLVSLSLSGSLSLRLAIQMICQAGDDLPGIFLLTIAIAMTNKTLPESGVDRELAALYCSLAQVRSQHVEPVWSAPPLLTGKDLIEVLHLQPGPLFKRILSTIEEAQMTGEVNDIDSALRLARKISILSAY